MKSYSLSHLDDHALLRDLATLVSQDCATTAALLAHLAEVDERKLYRPAAYSSMHLYCVRELRMSEDMAQKRIRAARTGRRFPVIFPALADGRMNLSAVLLLTPALMTPDLAPKTANELLAAAAHKTNAEIELLLAERFPKSDMLTLVQAITPPIATDEVAVRPVEADAQSGLNPVETASVEVAVRPPAPTTPQLVLKRPARARLTPLSPGRFALQVTVDQETYDHLRDAQSLLGHALPSGDIPTVLKRALGLLVQQLEQRKFGKSAQSRPRRSSGNGRYIPAAIRNTIWRRDGGQCAFVGENGKRCEERKGLDFDHVDPVARGGQTSVDRMRLLCRAHNQYTADCTFGPGFMREKREQAQRAAQARKRARSEVATAEAATPASQPEVLSCLRRLGFTAEEAHQSAALCAGIPDAPLDKRVHVALRGLAPAWARREQSTSGAAAE